MSKLAEALDAVGPPRCAVAKLLGELDKDDQAALLRYIDNYRKHKPISGQHAPWSPGGLTRLLAAAGLKIGETSVTKHLTERCTCERAG